MQPITDLVDPLASRGFRPVARLRPRSAKEIGSSSWCVGCETVDRRYVDFNAIKPHLGELGATQVRLQAGWARCEPNADGNYDWAWLDQCVNSSVEMGLRPWLQTSYGNPAYEGGGGIGLTQGIPSSEKALAAWDRWVRAMAERYGDRVYAWEIWNEADHGNDPVPPEDYGRLVLRTATIIHEVVANPRIYTLSMAGRSPAYADEALAVLSRAGRGNWVTAALFHGYPHNPDCDFANLGPLTETVRRHAPQAQMIQGECGAPSERNELLAMRQFEWSPRKQAAWNLRRMLAHHARGYAMNLFQISDMQYRKELGARFEGRNAKGLVETRADGSAVGRKPAYFAAQHIFSTFDGDYPPGAHAPLQANAPFGVSAYAWQREGHAAPTLAAWWRSDEPPALEAPELAKVALAPMSLSDPVLVDFLSGQVFELPTDDAWSQLPCADTPLAIAERDTLITMPLQETR